MLNAKDLELLVAKGIGEKQIEEQLACFVKGFPFLEITASASVEKGIMWRSRLYLQSFCLTSSRSHFR